MAGGREFVPAPERSNCLCFLRFEISAEALQILRRTVQANLAPFPEAHAGTGEADNPLADTHPLERRGSPGNVW